MLQIMQQDWLASLPKQIISFVFNPEQMKLELFLVACFAIRSCSFYSYLIKNKNNKNKNAAKHLSYEYS